MRQICVLLALCFSCNLVFSQEKYPVRVQVQDMDGESIPFASISVADEGGYTNEEGYLKLNLSKGNHKVKVRSVGFREKQTVIEVPTKKPILITLDKDAVKLDEVIVTATRTSRQIDNIPIPVEVMSGETIQKMGSLRLNEALQEINGVQIVSDHGTGMQLQGLNSDYILFLIDGEPVIGRTAGTLDLERLAVDNIERVEIIKGPTSSLYGSEAMAGVVNIITKEPEIGFSGSVRGRARSFGTSNLSSDLNYANDKLKAGLFVDRLNSAGYDLTEETVSMTAPPFTAYTVNPKVQYQFKKGIDLSVNGRFYVEEQRNSSDINLSGDIVRINDESEQKDWSIMPTLKLELAENHQTQIRSYTTGYRTQTSLAFEDDGTIYNENFFNQQFNRSEIQHDWYINKNNIATVGVGHTIETVEATRYDDVNAFRASYGFVQHQWNKGEKWNLIVGGRFDTHSEYASRFSPKMALGFNVNEWLKLQASFGGGYKAPDFRQLLLNFTNPVVGYTVIGSSIVQSRMAELQNEGQIERILIDPASIETIEAESSLAYNLGASLSFSPGLSADINLFRNEISNLIEAAPIARKTNGQNIFSYFNYDNVITQGIEASGRYVFSEELEFSAGYQYLDSRNLEDIASLENGEVFRRDPATNITEQVKLSDYGGLPNRSRHSGNAKIFYTNMQHQFDVSLRAIYRGRWGLGDANGNGIIDVDNEYADGYILLNLAVNKQIFKFLNIEAGANNILDSRNMFEPSMPGRIWFAGINMNF